jgi:hypothetical protein
MQNDNSSAHPQIVIAIGVEAAPRVFADYANESEQQRLEDWVNSQDALVELVCLAFEIEEEAKEARLA